MNKTSLALALGIGLAVSSAYPARLRADVIQTLSTPDMSASQFSSLFQPVLDPSGNAVTSSSQYQLLGAPVSGTVYSEVFKGTGAAAGLYAYAYEIGVNNVNTNSGEPVHVDSMSFQYNATPTGTNFVDSTGHNYYGYVVKDGQVGSLPTPAAAPGQTIQSPTTLSWQPGSSIGTIRAQYVDPAAQTPALGAGANSATFVVISNQPYTQQFVNLGSSVPQAPILQNGQLVYTSVYAAQGGSIQPVPAPEPTTILAWAGLAGVAAVARRFRKPVA